MLRLVATFGFSRCGRPPAAAFSSKKLPEAAPLAEADLLETFARGDGPGGRAVAAARNCVRLMHVPTGTSVRCHATRSLEENRRLARRALARAVDAASAAAGGPASARMLAGDRVAAASARAHTRSSRRHAAIREAKLAAASATAGSPTARGAAAQDGLLQQPLRLKPPLA